MDQGQALPTLLPEFSLTHSTAPSAYSGVIKVKNHEFRLRIVPPPQHSRKLVDTTIQTCPTLALLLRDYDDVVLQRLRQSPDIASFLVEFRDLLERIVSAAELNGQFLSSAGSRPGSVPASDDPTSFPAASSLLSSAFYVRVVADLEKIGWQHVEHVDESLSAVCLVARDEANRAHQLVLKPHPLHPAVPPTVVATLPLPFSIARWMERSTLQDAYMQFQQALAKYQLLWNDLDELDANTWVLEPEHPMRNCCSRRVALEHNSSIQLVVTPASPRDIPECRFLGADSVIGPLRERLNKNLYHWNASLSLLTNLRTVLQIEFPSPQTVPKDQVTVGCGICYTYRLGDSIPDKVCDGAKCRQPFHHECLLEWLRTLPTAHQSFNTIFGECPYCSKPITLKMVR